MTGRDSGMWLCLSPSCVFVDRRRMRNFESVADLSRAADAAALICSVLCAETEDRSRVSELTCVTLTLVDKITSTPMVHGAPPHLRRYTGEISRLLFQHMDLMSTLVCQFEAEERIISHLAAKAASSYVFYHLLASRVLDPVWQQKCVQVLGRPCPSAELEACMWSLTDVLKRLLKGRHQDILLELLGAFESSLSALCSELLHIESCSTPGFTSSTHWGTSAFTLLQLLELLTACRSVCGASACLRSQRLSHLHASALLSSVSSSSHYFVKKQALLLLKRMVLQQAGEDMALGELRYEDCSSDSRALADSVLQALAADWLQHVEVQSASFFGGSSQEGGAEAQKADRVTLRAVSLVILKSVELQIQTAAGADAYGTVQTLWSFLRRCRLPLMEAAHRCCWFSLLFGEQDDDMMEAAKALLSIFLHHRSCDSTAMETACASGCNPHCHFLLLLKSISFDHSILLDFLISTETCFLEYLVRYLKYVQADWQGFTWACQRMDSESECHHAEQLSLTAASPICQPVGGICLTSGHCLVEYGSSEESDAETMEVSEDSEKSRESDSIAHMPPSGPTPRLSGQTSARALSCLTQLRQVVIRLQTKKLFPYNPSSLLKLLTHIQTLNSSQY
ncbi:hypothetical protein LDENG_00073200 [Lucifuga dentata]|nr:hypothetical protein LDENG_00073200 [Lucifuga dentata]